MQRWVRENFSLMAAPRSGSNPARSYRWDMAEPGRAEIFAPPTYRPGKA